MRVERGTKPKPIYWKEAFSRQTFSLAFNKTIDLNVLNKYLWKNFRIYAENNYVRMRMNTYMQKTCDVAEKAILAKKKLRKKCVNRDKM